MQPDSFHPRFFIALMPPRDVQEQVNQVIQDLHERYQTRTAKAPPHITLQPPFLWPIASVSVLERAIATFAQTCVEVPIHLSGFGCFAPRVIYIDVVKSTELMTLQADLAAHLERELNIVHKKSSHRRFSPHVTVASRNVTPKVFQSIWTSLDTRSIQFEYVCDRLTLLIYDEKGWYIHREFDLQAKRPN